jgi:N6-adenosine-specific RNA methylase IME4
MYRTIVVDPPWPITWTTGKTRVNGRGERHVNHKRDIGYKLMSIAEILALRIPAEADAHLYLWTVDRFLMDGTAIRVAKVWGFEPKRLLIWRKTGFGLGSFPRPQHEHCLIATRGRLPFRVRNVGSVQTWKLVYERRGASAGRKHSAKPDEFFKLVEQASPGPYLEMFARKRRNGWISVGDEVPVESRKDES